MAQQPVRTPSPLDPEDVALWYFRLQGCLTIQNFMIHRFDGTGGAYSDADVIAVRFPHRQEQQMEMFEQFFSRDKIDLSFVEVKTGWASINRSWRSADTLAHVISRIGICPPDRVAEAANSIARTWVYETDTIRIRMVIACKEKRLADDLPPDSQQLTWAEEILPTIFRRFRDFQQPKSYHNWDRTGRELYKAVRQYRRVETDYIEHVLERMRDRSGRIDAAEW